MKLKKLTGALLSVFMLVAMAPTMAFANGTNYFEVTINGVTTQHATAGAAYQEITKSSSNMATIKLLDNYTGPGLKVGENKNVNLTFDLNDKKWNVTGPLVGSTGTETNAFQLLSGSTVTFKNGAVTSSVASILFQNYCDLTVDNVDVSLTTSGTGKYAMSNNNASTKITGGSTVTVNKGNYALDSFTFGSYTGGNVTIETATINGDVEIANGGKLALSGGTIDGNVTVYNYKYDDNANKSPSFTMASGKVTGNVATSKKGQTTISGGEVSGKVSLEKEESDTAVVTVTGGKFAQPVTQFVPEGSMAVGYTSGNITLYAVGDSASEIIEGAKEGETITLLKGNEITVPDGVTVKNETGSTITVNGATVENDAQIDAHVHQYTTLKSDANAHWHECACGAKANDSTAHTWKWVVDKEATATEKGSKHEECEVCGYKKAAVEIPATGTTTKPEPTDKPTDKPVNKDKTASPKTGDESSLALWLALAGMSAAALGGVAYGRKRKQER